jgi:hypothetical protein
MFQNLAKYPHPDDNYIHINVINQFPTTSLLLKHSFPLWLQTPVTGDIWYTAVAYIYHKLDVGIFNIRGLFEK